jgi:DNA (cytosine-5)-methyltransferase 1
MTVIKYIDLCCGIGGFRIAIEQFEKHSNKKFKCVFSADIKSDAIRTYNLNFNENMKKTDLYKINIEKIPQFDLLCCGFPCQPFSSAGNKQGFNDERGGMIFRIIDICKYHKPSTIILENVSNLISLSNGEYIKKIYEMFFELNYNVFFKDLNAQDFGVPQNRQRVFIVCLRNNNFSFLNIKYYPKKYIENIIDYESKYTNIQLDFAKKILELHKKCELYGFKIQDKRGGCKNIHSWDLELFGKISNDEKMLLNKILLERRKKHWCKEKNIKWMDGIPLTFQDIQSFFNSDNLQMMLNHLNELGYLKYEKCKDLINGKREYTNNTDYGYNICHGKLSFPISHILDPKKVSPTLTATDSHKLAIIIHNQYIRRLTDLELKRLSGFPDNFKIIEKTNIYDLFGNTIIPNIIYEILFLIYK